MSGAVGGQRSGARSRMMMVRFIVMNLAEKGMS